MIDIKSINLRQLPSNRRYPFSIATHSPILVAFPVATILNFVDGDILPARFDELEHVRLMRDFCRIPRHFSTTYETPDYFHR
jgi:predicted ATPase